MLRFLATRPLAVCLLLLSVALPGLARAETAWASLKSDPYYTDVRAELLALVNIEGFHAGNNFCVVDQRFDDRSEQAMVYWPTQDWLIEWDQIAGNMDSMVTSNALNLSTDVIPSEDGIHGSGYLTIPGWTQNMIHECNRHGDFYHVTRSAGGWHKPEDFPQFSTLPEQLQTLIVPTPFLIETGIANDMAYLLPGKPLKPANHFCAVANDVVEYGK